MQFVENQPTFRRNLWPPSSWSKYETSMKQITREAEYILIAPSMEICIMLPASFLFLAWLILLLSIWRQHVPPKRQLTSNGLHGVISRKIGLFI
jgi:hypothetical protein